MHAKKISFNEVIRAWRSMIYIDCTTTYVTNMLTGIQRVVYNIIEKASTEEESVSVVQPIVLSTEGFLPIESLPKHHYTLSSTMNVKKREKISDWIRWFNLRQFPFVYTVLKNIYFTYKRHSIAKTLKKPNIQFTHNDTLVLLDACWSLPIWKEVQRAKNEGARIIFVIYDLIPIRFPNYCDYTHTKAFKSFLFKSLDYADLYMGISQTVMQDIKAFTLENGNKNVERIQFDYFYLGADFSQQISDKTVRVEIKNFFKGNTPVFLTVSTIEPRKNHVTILKVFDRLWAKGLDVKLCFIGKVGWQVEEFIEIIQSHKMLGDKFIMLNDADDYELSYAYYHARQLIFASFVEGFGLPIIEAMDFGLPVLASDIPIHKEIGGKNIEYFDLNDNNSLLEKIEETLVKVKENRKISWINWGESTRYFLNKLI